MKFIAIYLLATSLVFGSCSGCASTPPSPKPSPSKPQPDGEKALRDSLAHTKPQPRQK